MTRSSEISGLQPKDRRRHAAWAILAITLLAHALSAGRAQSETSKDPLEGYNPPVFRAGMINLMEALELTLQNVPSIKLQEADAASKTGAAQEATGAFDLTLLGKLKAERTQDELTEKVKQQERKQRDDLRNDAQDLRIQEDAAQTRMNEFHEALRTLQMGGDPHEIRFTNDIDQADWNLLLELYETTTDPERVNRVIEEYLAAQEASSTDEYQNLNRRRLEAETRLRDLGGVPRSEWNYSTELNIELRKKFRTGPTIGPFMQLTSSGTNYVGKPRAAEYGGKGATDNYQTTLGFKVELPLGRGKGLLAASGAERAAILTRDASIATVAHTASSSLHETIVAYWRLVAAQRRLDAKNQSLEMHQQLLTTTRSLVEARQLSRTELSRELAREAEANAQVADAQRTVDEMRLDLAKKIGLKVDELFQAPYAADDFFQSPGEAELSAVDASALAAYAVAYRKDLKAATLNQEAGKVSWEAAKVDISKKSDLKLEVSASGKDSENLVSKGIAGSMSTWAGPTGKADYALEWPLGNNAQEGKERQKRALYAQQWIKAQDLERTIRLDVVQTISALQTETRNCEHLRQALTNYDESVAGEIEKFNQGLTTLSDLISTEQRQLDARIALVTSEQRIAEYLADLRFQTSTLMVERGGKAFSVLTDLNALPDLRRISRPRSGEDDR